MRFLCLSGMGTNAQILELQLSAITGKLQEQHEFSYINGDVHSEPGPGIAEIFNGPYSSFWDFPTSKQLRAALDLIGDTIDDDGPFDVILGYSQGAGMAATYLIQDALSNAPQDHFRCAIFVNANMPFNPDSRTFRSDAAGKLIWSDNRQPVDFDVSKEYPEVDDALYGSLMALEDGGEICQRYQPSDNPLITIPTTHVVGAEDDLYRSQGYQLHDLCDPRYREVIVHRGNHSIPKDVINTSKIVRGIESLLQRTLIG